MHYWEFVRALHNNNNNDVGDDGKDAKHVIGYRPCLPDRLTALSVERSKSGKTHLKLPTSEPPTNQHTQRIMKLSSKVSERWHDVVGTLGVPDTDDLL